MNTLKNLRDITVDLAFAAAAVTAAAVIVAPASAAVIQSAPTQAVFGSELRFVPASRGEFLFDASLGTLNTITLSFDGTIRAAIGGQVGAEASGLTAVTANVGITTGWRTVASFDPISVPVTLTERPGDTAYPYGIEGSATAPVSFAATVAGQDALSDAFYTDLRFADIRTGTYSPFTDAIFSGRVTAWFDYTPAGGGIATADASTTNVPEPASLALLGIGLVGLIATRRRTA